MSAEIIQFIPRPNPDRASQPDPIATMAVDILAQIWPEDTAPSEMNMDEGA